MTSKKDLQHLSIRVAYGKKIADRVNPAIDLVLFVRKPFIDWAKDYTRVYKAFLDEFGDHFTYCGYGTGKWLKATKHQLEKSLTWKENKKIIEDRILVFDVHSGTGEDAYWCPKTPSFEFAMDQLGKEYTSGHFRCSFPITYSAEKIIEFALKNLKDLPLHAGYAGYGLLCDGNFTYNQHWTKRFVELLKMYPGLNHPDADRIGIWARNKLIVVNWLTFLGEDLIAHLGGLDKIKNDLRADFIFHSIGTSLCIQAGKKPELGKENADSLPLYQKLGRYLNSIRADDKNIREMGIAGIQSEEEEFDWYLRFFK